MPEIAVVSNLRQPLHQILSAELRGSDEFRAASAFLNSGGLSHIMPELQRILSDEGSVHIVHGADFRITDPRAVRDLVELKMHHTNMSYFVHCDWNLTTLQSFHPNLYITTPDYRNYCAIIGSSNLTHGGLIENIEINTVIRGDDSEEPVSQCLSAFESILNHTALLQPDLTFVEKYQYLYENAESLPLTHEPPYELSDLYQQLIALQFNTSQYWQPRTQVEFVIKALENLAEGNPETYLDLSATYTEAERLARSAEEQYKWDTFPNSLRRSINQNTVGTGGRDLFERRGGLAGRFGQYRLSEKGRAYGRDKSKG